MDNSGLKEKIISIIIMAVVGLLTLYFAGGWTGLLNSKP